jgi:2-dehydro-3-deoxyphosphooctonate aldolase (KDO 8-P synthase)
LNFIFKGSFDKANRTSHTGERGLGVHEGLRVLEAVKKEVGIPVLTDVHLPEQCAIVAEVADVLQIPAFLCRQTDLLVQAAKTGKPINIKKGQFLAPWDMEHVVAKVTQAGNHDVMLTERGTSFGYNTLVTDMRALPQMKRIGFPVIMDATHAVQMPGGRGGSSGGQREFAPVLARAAVSLGIAGVFIETHPDPDNAPSDGPNMIVLDQMADLISDLAAFDRLSKDRPLKV